MHFFHLRKKSDFFALLSCGSDNETNYPSALCTFSRDYGCLVGRNGVAKGLILPHACTRVLVRVITGIWPCHAKPRRGIHVRVYISRTMAHTPLLMPVRDSILSTFSLSFSLSPCARALIARLSESGKTIDEDGWRRASRKGIGDQGRISH